MYAGFSVLRLCKCSVFCSLFCILFVFVSVHDCVCAFCVHSVCVLCANCVRNIRILYIFYSCACAYLCRGICVYVCICVRMYVRMCGRCSVEVRRTQSDTPHVGILCGYRVRIIKAKKLNLN